MIEAAERPRMRTAGGRAEPVLLAFLRRLDWILLAAAVGLVAYGLWVVSGITRFDVPGDENYYVVRQGVATGIGLIGLAVAALVPIDVMRRHWQLVYGVTLSLIVVVFVAAETIRGSKRWIDLGFIQFQPSELGKVLFVLAIAGFLVERAGRATRWRTILSALGLGAAPILLVFLQPDLGTALVYGAALLAVLFFVLEALHPGVGLFGAFGTVSLVLGGLFMLGGSGAPGLPGDGLQVSRWLLAGIGVAGALLVLVFVRELRLSHRQVYVSPYARERLLGELAQVTVRLAPQGEVRLAGETWGAELRGADSAEVGERVRVAELSQLGLLVEPAESTEPQAEPVHSPVDPGR